MKRLLFTLICITNIYALLWAQESVTFRRATSIESGKRYLITVEEEYGTAVPIKESYSYGYLYTQTVSIDDEIICETTANAYIIETAQGGYTIKDSYDRYLYMKDNYTSFNVSTELPDEGGIWSISFNSEGEAIINNTLKDKTIQYSTQHGSFGAYPDVRGIYPTLYGEEKVQEEDKEEGNIGTKPTTQYYDAIDGKRGKEVKTMLQDAIDEHTQRTYANLWTDFRTTDCRADGKVWDMYSGITNYVFGEDQSTGGGGREGADYNREHSMPKSWFNEGYPMYTDLFHLYPTDSYINNMRSNYPFGEVNTIKKQSEGGFSKLGTCAVSGYSGTVFEPADEYKGDFARTYFYMATRYESQIATWKSDMLAGNAYPAFTQWAITMLLKWHREDPVSEKEIKRNEAVYTIQKNRNPYIDYPVLAEFVWGELTEVSVDISKLVLHSNEYDLDEDTDTSIKELSTTESEAIIYDLTGRQITNPTKGIYIVNGKKRIAL